MANTVFFLGAGASYTSDFKLPTMKGFFEDEHLKTFPNLKKFIQKVYPKNPFQEINMEYLITHLEMTLEGFGALWRPPNQDIIDARREFTNYIVDRLSNPVGKRVCKKHRRLFEKLDGRDTVLSLNYDSVAENALFELSPKESNGKMKHQMMKGILDRSYDLLGKVDFWDWTPPSMFLEHRQLGYCIQLHGSINWLYCPNENCHFHKFVFPNRVDYPEFQYHAGDPCQMCGSGLELVIVPPTMRKAFERFPKFGLLWNLAFRKLMEAEQLIMIGVSLPDSDYYLKWLIREATLNRKSPPQLTIVNPDDDAICRAKSLIGVEEAKTFPDLDQFIAEGLPPI